MNPFPTDTRPDEPSSAHSGLGLALAAPPADVQALLDSEATALALYFDAQRAQACARSQRDWPELWRLARAAG